MNRFAQVYVASDTSRTDPGLFILCLLKACFTHPARVVWTGCSWSYDSTPTLTALSWVTLLSGRSLTDWGLLEAAGEDRQVLKVFKPRGPRAAGWTVVSQNWEWWVRETIHVWKGRYKRNWPIKWLIMKHFLFVSSLQRKWKKIHETMREQRAPESYPNREFPIQGISKLLVYKLDTRYFFLIFSFPGLWFLLLPWLQRWLPASV